MTRPSKIYCPARSPSPTFWLATVSNNVNDPGSTIAVGDPERFVAVNASSLNFQDSWQATKRLSLTLVSATSTLAQCTASTLTSLILSRVQAWVALPAGQVFSRRTATTLPRALALHIRPTKKAIS